MSRFGELASNFWHLNFFLTMTLLLRCVTPCTDMSLICPHLCLEWPDWHMIAICSVTLSLYKDLDVACWSLSYTSLRLDTDGCLFLSVEYCKRCRKPVYARFLHDIRTSESPFTSPLQLKGAYGAAFQRLLHITRCSPMLPLVAAPLTRYPPTC